MATIMSDMPTTMATRAALMHRLATIPTEDLLKLMEDQTIFDLATKYFQNASSTQPEGVDTSSNVEPASGAPLPKPAKDKAKRPLNAFMAFRSYYLKLFPDVQQKSASGFLTTLWNQDPYRNRWALIARVYSFIRDVIGKVKIPLASFLKQCCPVMKIIEPSCYLSSLGWSVENGDDGSQNLVRLNAAASAEIAQLQSQVFPNTEIDLLSSLINIGYLPEESFELMEKMSVNRSGIMTTTNLFKPPVTINTKKMDFINTIRSDPLQATKELFTYHYDEETVQQHGYRHHEVDDTNFITYHPMSPPTPEPAPEPSYQYATTHAHIGLDDDPIFSFDVPEHECLDLDNPFDMDRVLGWTQMEAQRAVGFPDSPPYDELTDFHFMF